MIEQTLHSEHLLFLVCYISQGLSCWYFWRARPSLLPCVGHHWPHRPGWSNLHGPAGCGKRVTRKRGRPLHSPCYPLSNRYHKTYEHPRINMALACQQPKTEVYIYIYKDTRYSINVSYLLVRSWMISRLKNMMLTGVFLWALQSHTEDYQLSVMWLHTHLGFLLSTALYFPLCIDMDMFWLKDTDTCCLLYLRLYWSQILLGIIGLNVEMQLHYIQPYIQS